MTTREMGRRLQLETAMETPSEPGAPSWKELEKYCARVVAASSRCLVLMIEREP